VIRHWAAGRLGGAIRKDRWNRPGLEAGRSWIL